MNRLRAIFVTVITLLASCSGAVAYEIKGNTLVLTAAEVAACRGEGGCLLVSLTRLGEEVQIARGHGLRAGVNSCKRIDL